MSRPIYAPVKIGDDILPLTYAERAMMRTLMRFRGETVDYAALAEAAGSRASDPTALVHVTICHIRSKIARYNSAPVQAVRGIGYRLPTHAEAARLAGVAA